MSDEVKMWVPVGDWSETDLMAALDRVVLQFQIAPSSSVSNVAASRAVDWLASKYGSRALAAEVLHRCT